LRFEIRPVIKNTGQTPAHDVVMYARAVILPTALPPNFDFRAPADLSGGSVMMLGPNQDRFTSAILPRRLSFAELRGIFTAQTVRLYVYGTVTYRDAFKRRRWTNFCYSIVWLPRRGNMWHATTRHNDAN
jgi:hypothetical protein